jgi:hypothetical protein
VICRAAAIACGTGAGVEVSQGEPRRGLRECSTKKVKMSTTGESIPFVEDVRRVLLRGIST